MLILWKLGRIAEGLLRAHGLDGSATTDREPGRFEPAADSHKAAATQAEGVAGTDAEMREPAQSVGAPFTPLAGRPATLGEGSPRGAGGAPSLPFEKIELKRSPILSRRGVEGPAFHELQDEEPSREGR